MSMSRPTAAYALALSLLTHRASAACTFTGEIASFTGECNRANFEAALTGCSIGDLFSDADAEIADLCEYEAPVQFVEINGFYQLDRRYMDGGGPLVDGQEGFAIESARVLRFDANAGGKKLIGWPEYAALVEYNDRNGLGAHGYPPNFDLENSCDLDTVMCCFIDDEQGAGFAEGSTTDVCRHDLADSPKSNHIKSGWSVFPDEEAPTHCVGYTWKDGESSDLFKGNGLYDISLRNTVLQGYSKSIPGAPLCACIEQMPAVARADCRRVAAGPVKYTFSHDAATGEISGSTAVDVQYEDCPDDLAATFKALHPDRAAAIDEHLVGDCGRDLFEYLNERKFLVPGRSKTKYLDITEDDGWTFVAGEGIRFLPPEVDNRAADEKFRALIAAGCKNDDGTERPCIVRRFCDSCDRDTHRDIYYKRLTPIPSFEEVYFLDLFLNNWKSTPANKLGVDFQLYSTYEDALAGKNGWTYCNYDDNNVGFPRDCGPTGWAGNNWNSYFRSGASANHHGFYVEKP
ncbi:hypothetical protein ACHAXS_007759 [Conticribra weissflogii]